MQPGLDGMTMSVPACWLESELWDAIILVWRSKGARADKNTCSSSRSREGTCLQVTAAALMPQRAVSASSRATGVDPCTRLQHHHLEGDLTM